MNLTPQEALSNLITAARLARLTAEEHEAVQTSVRLLAEFINNQTANLTKEKGNLDKKDK